MTKSELIAEIAERTGQSKADVERTLKSFEDIAHEVVAKGGEKLTLPGFISFEQTHRNARTARNPQTGEPIQVPALIPLRDRRQQFPQFGIIGRLFRFD